MPGMDGFEMLAAIKKDPNIAVVPVVMYTSKEGEVYMGQARALGAMGVLLKPIQQAQLRKILQNLNLVEEVAQPEKATQLAAESINKEKDHVAVDDSIEDIARNAVEVTPVAGARQAHDLRLLQLEEVLPREGDLVLVAAGPGEIVGPRRGGIDVGDRDREEVAVVLADARVEAQLAGRRQRHPGRRRRHREGLVLRDHDTATGKIPVLLSLHASVVNSTHRQ